MLKPNIPQLYKRHQREKLRKIASEKLLPENVRWNK